MLLAYYSLYVSDKEGIHFIHIKSSNTTRTNCKNVYNPQNAVSELHKGKDSGERESEEAAKKTKHNVRKILNYFSERLKE
jgi:hypothetical protein